MRATLALAINLAVIGTVAASFGSGSSIKRPLKVVLDMHSFLAGVIRLLETDVLYAVYYPYALLDL
jgi:hypothetical protein